MKFNAFFDYPEDEASTQTESQSTTDLVFLANCSEEDWEMLLSYTETLYFHIGDLIISLDETDRGLYFVVNGQLEVLGLHPAQQQWYHVTTLDAHTVFGEQAFFDGKPRSAAVRAISDGTLLRLSPESFDALAARAPFLAHSILFDLARILSLRLRQTTSALASQTQYK
jgi:CRP-like cAMP-binding protein